VIGVDLVGSDRSGLLTLEASSVQKDPDRSRRIVWMINRMIKQAGESTEPSRVERARATEDQRPGGCQAIDVVP
jgi:hypothetical protein